MKKIGVIFDMDGVVSDTQKYHAQAEIEILKSYGIVTIDAQSDQIITHDRISWNFAWVQPKEWMKMLFEAHGKLDEFDPEIIEHQKYEKLLDMYEGGVAIEFIPGAEKFIKELCDEDIDAFVVTASTRDCMLFVLKTLGIEDKFTQLVSIYDTDEITWKPYAPKGEADVYERIVLNHGLDGFVMIEDGATGMNGAIKAGGKAIAILGENPVSKFPQAVLHYPDLTELEPERIRLLFS